jgi:hypothetical protein
MSFGKKNPLIYTNKIKQLLYGLPMILDQADPENGHGKEGLTVMPEIRNFKIFIGLYGIS